MGDIINAVPHILTYYLLEKSRGGELRHFFFSLNIQSKPNIMFRWPLVFRFIKGTIHADILLPVCLHALFTAFVVYLDTNVFDTVGLPASIVCALVRIQEMIFTHTNRTDSISLDCRWSYPRFS